MWRTHTKEPQCAYPRLHELRVGAGPRRERGQEYSMGRAGPSGSPYVGGGNEPRSPFPLGMGSMSPSLTWNSGTARRTSRMSGPGGRSCGSWQGADRHGSRRQHRLDARAWIGQIAKRYNAEGPAGMVKRQRTTMIPVPTALRARPDLTVDHPAAPTAWLRPP